MNSEEEEGSQKIQEKQEDMNVHNDGIKAT
jgi:hypothetical protein